MDISLQDMHAPMDDETATVYVLRPPLTHGNLDVDNTRIYVCDASDEHALEDYLHQAKIRTAYLLRKFTGGDYWHAARRFENRLHQRMFVPLLFTHRKPTGAFTRFCALADVREKNPRHLDDVLLDTCWTPS